MDQVQQNTFLKVSSLSQRIFALTNLFLAPSEGLNDINSYMKVKNRGGMDIDREALFMCEESYILGLKSHWFEEILK